MFRLVATFILVILFAISLSAQQTTIYQSSVPEADSLRSIAAAYWQQQNFRKSAEYGRRAMRVCEKAGDLECVAQNAFSAGMAYERSGMYVEALELYLTALTHFKTLKDHRMMFRVYDVIGNAYSFLEEHVTRLYWTKRALQQAQDLKDTLYIATFHAVSGDVYRRMGDTTQALVHFNRALELYRNLGEQQHVIRMLNNKALIYDATAVEKLTALRNAAQVAQIASQNDPQLLRLLAHIYTNIGNWHVAVAHHDSAVIYYNKAIQAAHLSGNRHLKIFLYSHLAQYFFDQNNHQRSKQLAHQALDIIHATVGSNHTFDVALKLLSQIYAAEGNHRRAHEFLTQWSSINDSLQARSKREELNKINSRLIFEKHRQEQLFEKQRKAERNRMYFIFALVGCLVIFSGWVIHSRIIMRKNRNLYLRIKEQDRLAEELQWVYNNANDDIPRTGVSHTPSPAYVTDDNEGVCNTPLPQDNEKHRTLVARLKSHLQTNQNFANPDTDIDYLISELATNRTYLFEAVKSVTGKTLQEYLNSLRLDQARHILTTTDEPVAMVAELCGYNTPQTFYRQFKERFGISPAEYRRQGKR